MRSQFGPFVIDVRERLLERDGQPVALTPKAFDLLAALVEQPGRLITKDELLRKVWPDTFVEESNLAYNVFALRKALGDTAEEGRFIETVPKRGYRFKAVLTPVGDGSVGRSISDGSAHRALVADCQDDVCGWLRQSSFCRCCMSPRDRDPDPSRPTPSGRCL